MNYIATREGVEALPVELRSQPATDKQLMLIHELLKSDPDLKTSSEYETFVEKRTIEAASELISSTVEENADNLDIYMNYIATRPRAEKMDDHGLFSDEDSIDLEAEKKAIQAHRGNVWRFIISLTREDAERLGYDNASAWRDLMRSQKTMLAEQMKIPLSDLKWFAAFHNERHHPHIHMMVYSDNPSKGYLTEQGLAQVKSELANDLFKDELLSVYQDMTHYRQDLTEAARMRVSDLTKELAEVTPDECEDMRLLKAQLAELSKQLSGIQGKKVYGYLPPALKNLVDEAADTLAKDDRISELYSLWYEKKYDTLRSYTDHLPEQIPLSNNKEFRAVKNAIVKAAVNMTVDLPEENVPMEESIAEGDRLADLAASAAEAASESSFEDSPIETPPWEMPLPDDPPPVEPTPEYGTSEEASYSRFEKQSTWWTDRYKEARKFLYGTQEIQPDHAKAMELLLLEAAAGNGFAMYDVGKMKLSGPACGSNEEKARQWFHKAYEAFLKELPNQKNPAYLEYRIGRLFALGQGVEQDYSTAAEWYEKSVGKGNPFAAYALGSLYRRGQGVERDDEKAYSLFYMAATHEKSPNAYAMYELGLMCRDGIGTKRDPDAANEWFEKAYKGFEEIIQSMPDDKLFYRLGQMNFTGVGTAVDLKKAEAYLQKAAKLNNLYALYGLGKLYLHPDFEGRDIDKAIDYFTKAAEGGLNFAQYKLGKLYLMGEEVPQDLDKALKWLAAAIENGSDSAMYLLGKELLSGERFSPDVTRAEIYLQQAVEQGSLFAAYTLGKAYAQGDRLKKDIPKAIELLTKVYEKSPECRLFAAYTLGKIYLQEDGYKDPQKALDYLSKAAESGNSYAAELLNRIQNRTVVSLLSGVNRIFIGAMRNHSYEPNKKPLRQSAPDSKLRREIEAKKQGQNFAD